MHDKVTILGSTGSIGRQTLEVLKKIGRVPAALCAHKNVDLLERQAREFRPSLAVMYDETCARELDSRLKGTGIDVMGGMGGLTAAAAHGEASVVVTAVEGMIGLRPTLAAIKAGKRIALANKETLVCAGDIVTKAAQEAGVEILPVDSEHSAIFQCLERGGREALERVILTASGGPFFFTPREQLENVTPDMALKHPTWSMGRKITIDSATMMNKGLEIIEAMWLYGLPENRIDVVVHRESVVHSLVEYADASILAQLGDADMRLPIQYALTWPQRVPSLALQLNLSQTISLSFYPPDERRFPCLALARQAARRGLGAHLNAANEAAVALFLDGRIGFYGISDAVEDALGTYGGRIPRNVDEICALSGEIMQYVNTEFGTRHKSDGK